MLSSMYLFVYMLAPYMCVIEQSIHQLSAPRKALRLAIQLESHTMGIARGVGGEQPPFGKNLDHENMLHRKK
jgi:hypothetical protein